MVVRRSQLQRVARDLESLLNRDIPKTPSFNGAQGGRVVYVRVPGARRGLQPRPKQVLAFLDEHKRRATAREIIKGCRINRNALAGAMHALRQAHLVKSEPLHVS